MNCVVSQVLLFKKDFLLHSILQPPTYRNLASSVLFLLPSLLHPLFTLQKFFEISDLLQVPLSYLGICHFLNTFIILVGSW